MKWVCTLGTSITRARDKDRRTKTSGAPDEWMRAAMASGNLGRWIKLDHRTRILAVER